MEKKQITTIIRPRKGLINIDLKEIWEYRELLYYLTWRDIKVRYKQTALGIIWAVLQPFLTMIVFSVFFGRIAGIPSENLPYPIFVYSGLLLWNFFSDGVTRAADSMITNANLVRKIYFPRVFIPASAIASSFVDFLIAFAVFLALMVYYGLMPGASVLWVPLLVLMTVFCSLGIGFVLSAMNAMFRDVRYAVPFFVKLGLFVTPVIYPVSYITGKLGWLMYINPLSGIIEAFRFSMLRSGVFPVFGVGMSIAITAGVFLFGLLFFKKMEDIFSDII